MAKRGVAAEAKVYYQDQGNTMFVKNLAKEITNEELFAAIANQQAVRELRVVRDAQGACKGYAYVEFCDAEACRSGVEGLQGASLRGRSAQAFVSEPPKLHKKDDKTIFLNNLPFELSESEIYERLAEFREEIKEVRLIKDQEGKNRGYGYLQLREQSEHREQIAEFIAQHSEFQGRKIKVKRADFDGVEQQKRHNVAFLKGLAFKVTERDLFDFFGMENLRQIKIVRDDKGRNRGMAYVEFRNHAKLSHALDLKTGALRGRDFSIVKSDRQITNKKGEAPAVFADGQGDDPEAEEQRLREEEEEEVRQYKEQLRRQKREDKGKAKKKKKKRVSLLDDVQAIKEDAGAPEDPPAELPDTAAEREELFPVPAARAKKGNDFFRKFL